MVTEIIMCHLLHRLLVLILCAQTDTKGQAAFLSLPKPKLSYFYGSIVMQTKWVEGTD